MSALRLSEITAKPIGRPVIPPIASEHQEQAALIEWWSYAHRRWELPEFALFAIPNGGARHIVVASKLKAEGVRKGIPDLLLAVPIWPHAGLFIEMKSSSPQARVKADQATAIGFLRGAGYKIAVCKGAAQAMDVIEAYLNCVRAVASPPAEE